MIYHRININTLDSHALTQDQVGLSAHSDKQQYPHTDMSHHQHASTEPWMFAFERAEVKKSRDSHKSEQLGPEACAVTCAEC